ncbi:unnamed protein product [Rotaria socialis]|uniref:Uncharacterized protein n=1 Tax=Rotaria socialis TaxID=392032 RepID=A0A817UFN1_9BILA|nr:unnamed protein product [Rotaria socialis]CAF3278828.1 unnamed protein product [Rotaria socialis]CAF3326109.1 unnamed protein product [Rotaria socialis]CAF3649686.1 unnamed protein product [Rotaria socialis]CAF4162345.1 unnamed protein product [Rotaria socialis]
MRPTSRVGQQPVIWLLFLLRLRKFIRLRYLLCIFLLLIIITYLRLNNSDPSYPIKPNRDKLTDIDNKILPRAENINNDNDHHLVDKCNFDATESILRYKSLKASNDDTNDNRARPTIQRLHSLFSILISTEEKYRKVLEYLGVFRFTDLYNTLIPFANNTQRLHDIYCHFQRYITISDNGHIDIAPNFINYLKQVSNYLSDGFTSEHSLWTKTPINDLKKPVIILGANSRFYDTFQASMRTVNQYFLNSTIAIYDLGFDGNQLNMIKENCERCIIIGFPFREIESVAPHVRQLPNFAWKPIIVQDAVRRFGTIIYGDTSVRYLTSDFNRIIIDNLIRGFACRELPDHYLSCYTLGGTFSWFNETNSAFDDIYIAEAGFVAVTDNFLSRLVLKTWVTCALDGNCIAPSNSRTQCKRLVGAGSGIHRYDQSAMVAVLSFYFFQSSRKNDRTEPAPYDMFSSIQKKVAEVRRFEGDHGYFTQRKKVEPEQNKTIPIHHR